MLGTNTTEEQTETEGTSKGKGLSLVSFCVVYQCVSLERYIAWTSNETEFPIPPFTSPTGERRATFTDSQTFPISLCTHTYRQKTTVPRCAGELWFELPY